MERRRALPYATRSYNFNDIYQLVFFFLFSVPDAAQNRKNAATEHQAERAQAGARARQPVGRSAGRVVGGGSDADAGADDGRPTTAAAPAGGHHVRRRGGPTPAAALRHSRRFRNGTAAAGLHDGAGRDEPRPIDGRRRVVVRVQPAVVRRAKHQHRVPDGAGSAHQRGPRRTGGRGAAALSRAAPRGPRAYSRISVRRRDTPGQPRRRGGGRNTRRFGPVLVRGCGGDECTKTKKTNR